MYRGYKMLKVLKILKYLFLLTLINCSETCSDLHTIYNVVKSPEDLDKAIVYENFDLNKNNYVKLLKIEPKHKGKYLIYVKSDKGSVKVFKHKAFDSGVIELQFLMGNKVIYTEIVNKIYVYGDCEIVRFQKGKRYFYYKSVEVGGFNYPLKGKSNYNENLFLKLTVLKKFKEIEDLGSKMKLHIVFDSRI